MRDEDPPALEHLDVSIVIRGGPADVGEIPLEDYRISLEGWQCLIELSARLFFLGERAEPTRKGVSPFSIRVRAPERGSITTEIILALQDEKVLAGLALGLVADEAMTLIKATSSKFVKWLIALCRSHVDTKAKSPSIEILAENLTRMLAAQETPALKLAPYISDTELPTEDLFKDPQGSNTSETISEPQPKFDRSQWLKQIIESIDTSLEEAVSPIGGGCTSIELQDVQGDKIVNTLVLDTKDHTTLVTPLSYVDADEEWKPARIKFRRIDRESGSVMFRNDDGPGRTQNQFGYIADKSYKRPHNPYTQALDADAPLDVWIHAERTPTKGTRYAISTSRPPRQTLLADFIGIDPNLVGPDAKYPKHLAALLGESERDAGRSLADPMGG